MEGELLTTYSRHDSLPIAKPWHRIETMDVWECRRPEENASAKGSAQSRSRRDERLRVGCKLTVFGCMGAFSLVIGYQLNGFGLCCRRVWDLCRCGTNPRCCEAWFPSPTNYRWGLSREKNQRLKIVVTFFRVEEDNFVLCNFFRRARTSINLALETVSTFNTTVVHGLFTCSF